MKIKNVILLFFVVKNLIIFAQINNKETPQKIKKNSVFVELGGNGFIGSVNYDRITGPIIPIIKMSLRLGLGPNIIPRAYYPIVPLVETNLLFGKNKHYFELGFGLNFYTEKVTTYSRTMQRTDIYWGPYKTIRLGYRFQKSNGGVFFRGGLTPIIGANEFSGSSGFLWGGLSIGYGF